MKHSAWRVSMRLICRQDALLSTLSGNDDPDNRTDGRPVAGARRHRMQVGDAATVPSKLWRGFRGTDETIQTLVPLLRGCRM